MTRPIAGFLSMGGAREGTGGSCLLCPCPPLKLSRPRKNFDGDKVFFVIIIII